MYKILVIEDETIIRKGLIYSFDFKKFNCNVIAEAIDGRDGILKIKEYKPDIIIVDINMPIINGLEMIKQTYKEYMYSAIIISGCNDFKYAKNAIQYNVSEYLLKPIDYKELEKALLKAIKQIEMKYSYLKNINKQKELQSIKLIKENRNTKSYVVNAMLKYIEENYNKKIKLEDLSNILKTSQTSLFNKFKEEIGTTFNDYLNRYRIKQAIILMKKNNMPIYEIAEITGFKNYKYFNYVFKKYIGYSATEFLETIF